MATKEHRINLFKSHLADLKSFSPQAKEVFICPICFEKYSIENIKRGLVDVGHVWPKYFRQVSEKAKHQQVLLCKSCNSNTGSNGDYLAQLEAQFREAEKSGDLGLRNVRINSNLPQREAIQLQLYFKRTGEQSAQIGFPKYTKENQRKYYDVLRKIFFQYADESEISITIFPLGGHPSKPFGDPTNGPLAQIGFLTSAYLLAFYQYGYKFIFQTCLDPVREYIKASFLKKVDDRLNFQESKDMCVQICPEPAHYARDPEISLVLPVDNEIPLYQEIRFLDYHIRLPVPLLPDNIERRELILGFLGTDEIPTQSGRPLHAISGNMFISNLDHSILDSL